MAALNRTGFFILIRRTATYVKENVSNAFIRVRCLLAKTNFKIDDVGISFKTTDWKYTNSPETEEILGVHLCHMDRYQENELQGQIWLPIQLKQAFDSIKTGKNYIVIILQGQLVMQSIHYNKNNDNLY